MERHGWKSQFRLRVLGLTSIFLLYVVRACCACHGGNQQDDAYFGDLGFAFRYFVDGEEQTHIPVAAEEELDGNQEAVLRRVLCFDDTSDVDTISANEADTSVFETSNELLEAIGSYMEAPRSAKTPAAKRYGYPLISWNVSQITHFQKAFSAARDARFADFNEDLSTWLAPGQALDITEMFQGAGFNGDLSMWDTSRVSSMAAVLHQVCGWVYFLIAELFLRG